jgi:CyaY protein
MTESEFHLAVDEILARIERSLELAPDLDFDAVEGILTIECGDGSRVIVNRQTPNREIWVAAKSGGFHYAFRDGAWRDTRSGTDLFAALAEIIVLQGGPRLSFAR